MTLDNILREIPPNKTILDNIVKAYSIINNPNYNKIICTISGGSDSDIVLDICTKCDNRKIIEYVWFDTGLEYGATKQHLHDLEIKYNIKIQRYRGKKAIPTVCKENGQPFLSKRISDMMGRLQKYNFEWKDGTFEELLKLYPRCKAALRWWCNEFGIDSQFNISNTKYLKEYILSNPPQFKISQDCCKFAKKDILHQCIKDGGFELNIYGVRKFEGGARARAYKNCYTLNGDCDEYRPIFYYTQSDKEDYETHCNIEHSDCYSVYGLKRTGCCGCPFGRNFEQELKVLQTYEPSLYNMVTTIFADSYDYTRNFYKFRKEKEHGTTN